MTKKQKKVGLQIDVDENTKVWSKYQFKIGETSVVLKMPASTFTVLKSVLSTLGGE